MLRLDPVVTDRVGNWRDVLNELPKRMHEWMPRLASEGVVGADAIFACLGPALEIFSSYSRVEKANGSVLTLKEYLEDVWRAVSKEALALIIDGPDAAGFEADARLTVIWFWVLSSAPKNGSVISDEEIEEDTEDEKPLGRKADGWQMEYDAVRKLSQGLGIDLQQLSKVGGIVTITGSVVTLNSVSYRDSALIRTERGREALRPASSQPNLFGDIDEEDALPKKKKRRRGSVVPPPTKVTLKGMEARREHLTDDEPEMRSGLFASIQDNRSLLQRMHDSARTTLDRVHQAMLLFGRYQGAMLSTFLVDEGVGKDARFWKLAQSLAALYPPGTDERRWVEGVLARKKGLGL